MALPPPAALRDDDNGTNHNGSLRIIKVITCLFTSKLLVFVFLSFLVSVFQLAETQVAHICVEAEGLMQERRWSDLVSLLLTSFDLVFANAHEKGVFISMHSRLTMVLLNLFTVLPARLTAFFSS